MTEIGYYSVADYTADQTTIDSYNSRSYIVTAPFELTSGESINIANKSISEIGSGTARLSVDVLGCF